MVFSKTSKKHSSRRVNQSEKSYDVLKNPLIWLAVIESSIFLHKMRRHLRKMLIRKSDTLFLKLILILSLCHSQPSISEVL